MEAPSLQTNTDNPEILPQTEETETNEIGACPIFYPTEAEFQDFQGYLE